MKNSILFSMTLLVSMVCLSNQVNAQTCNYAMSREHAAYFATSKGYNGYGMLPILSKADFKRILTDEWEEYYEFEVPTCSYCNNAGTLRSWDNNLALCNIANYYHHRYMTDVQGSLRFMDLEIERMSKKRN